MRKLLITSALPQEALVLHSGGSPHFSWFATLAASLSVFSENWSAVSLRTAKPFWSAPGAKLRAVSPSGSSTAFSAANVAWGSPVAVAFRVDASEPMYSGIRLSCPLLRAAFVSARVPKLNLRSTVKPFASRACA